MFWIILYDVFGFYIYFFSFTFIFLLFTNIFCLWKGVPWKSWLDPRFSRNSKSKWALKWLPLDRSYFKFYFHKGESILIITCHTYLLARNFVILFQVIFVLPCILFLFKMSRNLMLLIDHPSKRGDVKILAQSSISLSSHVKMKFKLTVSK